MGEFEGIMFGTPISPKGSYVLCSGERGQVQSQIVLGAREWVKAPGIGGLPAEPLLTLVFCGS